MPTLEWTRESRILFQDAHDAFCRAYFTASNGEGDLHDRALDVALVTVLRLAIERVEQCGAEALKASIVEREG